jgi:hypothetical protein
LSGSAWRCGLMFRAHRQRYSTRPVQSMGWYDPVQATLRRRLIESARQDMLAYQHSARAASRSMPFASADDRAALSGCQATAPAHPLRVNAQAKRAPPWRDHCANSTASLARTSVRRVDELHLTPLELIDRIAALVPPPRTHRSVSRRAGLCRHGRENVPAVVPLGHAISPTAEPAPHPNVHRAPTGGVDRPYLRSVPAAFARCVVGKCLIAFITEGV